MNEFRLFAHGEAFAPESYLGIATLKFDGVWRKGECGGGHPQSSGVFKTLGDGLTLPIVDQERLAIEYLSANGDSLKALANHPGVTTFILGLQYHIELDECTVGFCMGPSAALMRHCLEVGVQPTFYVSLDRRAECGSSFN